MPVIASILAAVIPIAGYLFLLSKLDKYNKNPGGDLIKYFLWGAIGANLFAVIGSAIASSFIHILFQITDDSITLWETILVAPPIEEWMKGIFLLIMIRSKNFDTVTDGLIYGGAIGLGFGMAENFSFFLAFGVDLQSWIRIVLRRSIFLALMHCMSTGIFGALLALAKFNSIPSKILLPIAGYFIAVFIHFFWNVAASFPSIYIFGVLFILLAAISFIVLFYLSLAYERKIIKKELEEETDISLIPSENEAILSSEKGNQKRWIDDGLRKRYIRNAVRLAFRKHQVKHSRDRFLKYYLEDISITREKLTEITGLIRQDYRAE